MDEHASTRIWRDYRTLIEGAMDDALADGQLRTQLSECRAMLATVRAHAAPDPEELAQTWRHLVRAVERFREHAPALDNGYGVYLGLLLVMWDEAGDEGGTAPGADVRRLIPSRLRPLLTSDPLILDASEPAERTAGRAHRNGRRHGVRPQRQSKSA